LEVAEVDVKVRYGWRCLTVALSLSLEPFACRFPVAALPAELFVPLVLVLLPCPFVNGTELLRTSTAHESRRRDTQMSSQEGFLERGRAAERGCRPSGKPNAQAFAIEKVAVIRPLEAASFHSAIRRFECFSGIST
jgi:hypothetical protein